MKRVLFFGLLVGLLTAGTGCGLFQAVFCGHAVLGGCGCGCCGDECDDCCGPACAPLSPSSRRLHAAPSRVADCDDGCGCGCARPCHSVGCRSCSPCGDSCCDPCADPCGNGCYARPWYRGPLSCVFAMFTPNCWCGPSCGERYWGDFYSDPPDCWDPCDHCGNYAGRGCHNCGGSHPGPSHGYVDDGSAMADGAELAPQAERERALPQDRLPRPQGRQAGFAVSNPREITRNHSHPRSTSRRAHSPAARARLLPGRCLEARLFDVALLRLLRWPRRSSARTGRGQLCCDADRRRVASRSREVPDCDRRRESPAGRRVQVGRSTAAARDPARH